MGLSGEEIRHRLTAFAAKWDVYRGSERSEAQTFLNQLFECYGTDRQEVGARFEEAQKGKFLDLIWPGRCIIEMKAPAEAKRLDKHRKQAFDYWEHSDDPATGLARPRWVVICAFNKLEVWEPGHFSTPRAVIDLVDLPDRYDALLFLAGDEPHFETDQAAVTRDAVALVSELYQRLRERRAADSEVLRNFIMQSVWSMFAEDLGQIPAHRFTQLVEGLLHDGKRSSADDLGNLFQWLNTPESEARYGMYTGTPYANGGLFRNPARVHLESDELTLLHKAAKEYRWRDVQPTIFGSLLEGGLGHDKQWHLGAHYTHEADIQKIVQPSIVEPWTERIENISKHAQAVAAQNDLMSYVVLDPACGSGNFLYVAYQELRRIEKRLRERETELRRSAGMKDQGALSLFFPLSNMKGIEIDGFAVALARVTLWMGHKLAVDELDLPEPTLPLADLSGIKQGHALREPWPKASVIIGNPPFHGASNLRRELGDAEVGWLQTEFGVGVKDYCVYWFRKAHDQLDEGQRAGFVATNSVSQNRNRSASLEYVARDGTITNAVSKQPWSGDAVVNVSVVNWVKGQHSGVRLLDGEEVTDIDAALRPATSGESSLHDATRLEANRGICFEGVKPAGSGFVLDGDEASSILTLGGPTYMKVIRPYLTGRDVTTEIGQAPTRWVIDFGMMSLEEAMEFPLALDIVRERVKPIRDTNRREAYRKYWWRFSEPRPAMRNAIAGLPRFLVATRVSKRTMFTWVDASVCPNDQTNVIALSDDAAFAVLSSRIHFAWARSQSSTLRVDIRYTPTTAFEPFPWPDLDAPHLSALRQLGKAIYEFRTATCRARGFGLTTLYNQMEEGAWADLQKLHRELDEVLVDAYGWPTSAAHDPDESNRQLLDLNRAIAAGEVRYSPFAWEVTA